MDIDVKVLTKAFGDELVLDKVSLRFPEHKITCVMGPSGMGKTTLLHILMGLVPFDTGTVEGVPVNRSAVFQEDRLCEDFMAASNVRLVCPQNVSDDCIFRHLEEIGLKENLEKPVKEFSGGMKRRVAMVRAVLADSEILFLDEPFKGLDEETKQDAITYLKRHRNNRTVIMVTHDIQEAKALDAEVVYIG
jgi:NitT/TauT family transport system ATP-binding protein